jgi:hypothetical protein
VLGCCCIVGGWEQAVSIASNSASITSLDFMILRPFIVIA